MMGEVPIKQEGMATAYDEDAVELLRPPRFVRFVRWLTRWAWEPEISQAEKDRYSVLDARKVAYLRALQLALLEDLFREKQAKIGRLQTSYSERRRPLYEDLRKENPIKDAESLAQSISAMAQRAEAYRERTGRRMSWSDGTVLGVPGDKPNVETGQGW